MLSVRVEETDMYHLNQVVKVALTKHGANNGMRLITRYHENTILTQYPSPNHRVSSNLSNLT